MIEVTIAIPVYNVERYVRKCILSALNQSFTLPYEILIIDDIGTDSSMDIIEEIAHSHPLGNIIRIIHHPRNLGLGPARNTAISEANGRYLFFLDSDDYITDNCISRLYQEAERNNSQITIGSTCRLFDGSGEIYKIESLRNMTCRGNGVMLKVLLGDAKPHLEVWNKLYLLSFLRTNNIHCYTKIFEDLLFDLEVYSLANNISFIEEITLYYINREGSITTNKSLSSIQEAINTRAEIITTMKTLVKKYSHIDGIYDFYLSQLLIHFYSVSNTQGIPLEILNSFASKTSGFTKCIRSSKLIHDETLKKIFKVCRVRNNNYYGFMESFRLKDMSVFEQLYIYPAKLFLHYIKLKLFHAT
ncbi:MAG: glycosyltransferase family 2 protein [Bacteroidales bacterium]|nr:glycosyltransferase family 2 protein [Bacteroidales bacterium]